LRHFDEESERLIARRVESDVLEKGNKMRTGEWEEFEPTTFREELSGKE